METMASLGLNGSVMPPLDSRVPDEWRILARSCCVSGGPVWAAPFVVARMASSDYLAQLIDKLPSDANKRS